MTSSIRVTAAEDHDPGKPIGADEIEKVHLGYLLKNTDRHDPGKDGKHIEQAFPIHTTHRAV
ncbi:MAG: hypothetical protein P8L18_15400 [Verrucomicrobiota bacterium]|nr:hypothetical protein [Verrucomicrobiota bacterium]